eukprot:TRINITY_DN19039_c0_g1_i6.p1 TRINITY_DN19039_c0_g1~~TRINITY_DN19039_c0_g1_i6.p1  ORF type:complete len:542 (+),score=65.17 TRINITY_DN19039_c0_g1_i6:52-1626(+)
MPRGPIADLDHARFLGCDATGSDAGTDWAAFKRYLWTTLAEHGRRDEREVFAASSVNEPDNESVTLPQRTGTVADRLLWAPETGTAAPAATGGYDAQLLALSSQVALQRLRRMYSNGRCAASWRLQQSATGPTVEKKFDLNALCMECPLGVLAAVLLHALLAVYHGCIQPRPGAAVAGKYLTDMARLERETADVSGSAQGVSGATTRVSALRGESFLLRAMVSGWPLFRLVGMLRWQLSSSDFQNATLPAEEANDVQGNLRTAGRRATLGLAQVKQCFNDGAVYLQSPERRHCLFSALMQLVSGGEDSTSGLPGMRQWSARDFQTWDELQRLLSDVPARKAWWQSPVWLPDYFVPVKLQDDFMFACMTAASCDPLAKANVLVPLSGRSALNREAIVTLLVPSSVVQSESEQLKQWTELLRTLVWSLRRVSAVERPVIVMYEETTHSKTWLRQWLTDNGLVPLPVAVLPVHPGLQLPCGSVAEQREDERWWLVLHLWRLTEFDRIVFNLSIGQSTNDYAVEAVSE